MPRLPPCGGQLTNPRLLWGSFERCLSTFRVTWKRRTPGWRSRCKPLMSKTASHKDDYVALMCSFRVPGAAADRERKARRRSVTHERELREREKTRTRAPLPPSPMSRFLGEERTAGGTSSCASEATFSPYLPRRFARGRLRQTPSDALARGQICKSYPPCPRRHAYESRNEACPIMCKFTSHRNSLVAYRISLDTLAVDSAAARHVLRLTYLRKKTRADFDRSLRAALPYHERGERRVDAGREKLPSHDTSDAAAIIHNETVTRFAMAQVFNSSHSAGASVWPA